MKRNTTEHDLRKLVTRAEIAQSLGISEHAVRHRMLLARIDPAAKVAHVLLYRREVIQKLDTSAAGTATNG